MRREAVEHRHRGLVLEEGAGGAARVVSVDRAIREHLEQGPSLLKRLLRSIFVGWMAQRQIRVGDGFSLNPRLLLSTAIHCYRGASGFSTRGAVASAPRMWSRDAADAICGILRQPWPLCFLPSIPSVLQAASLLGISVKSAGRSRSKRRWIAPRVVGTVRTGFYASTARTPAAVRVSVGTTAQTELKPI